MACDLRSFPAVAADTVDVAAVGCAGSVVVVMVVAVEYAAVELVVVCAAAAEQ